MNKNQRGLAHVALVVLLIVMAAAVFAAYTVVKNHQNNTVATTTNSAAAPPVQTITSKAGLSQAAQTLNSQAVDSDLNPDQLNSDVNSLL